MAADPRTLKPITRLLEAASLDLDAAQRLPWRDRFRPLEALSAYATAFRYSLSPKPKVEDLVEILAKLNKLYQLARTELLNS